MFVGAAKTFFLMMAYLGRPFGMSNKPHSKILLNAASFYLRGRLGGKICCGILAM